MDSPPCVDGRAGHWQLATEPRAAAECCVRRPAGSVRPKLQKREGKGEKSKGGVSRRTSVWVGGVPSSLGLISDGGQWVELVLQGTLHP